MLVVTNSVQNLRAPSSQHIPPNFLLPSPSSAFPVPSFVPAASASSSLSSSLSPSSLSLIDEMARRKRSPRSITWNRQVSNELNTKAEKCHICSDQLLSGIEPQPPVEGEDYFIDSDGTLTIKNGVCPRSLALSLFSEVAVKKGKYEEVLGENLVKFLLNLKQIIDKHREICPGEDSSDLHQANKVLEMHTSNASLSFPSIRKRSSELIRGNDRGSLVEYRQPPMKNKLEELEEEADSSAIPENFLHSPSESLQTQRSSSHKQKNLSSILSEPPVSGLAPSYLGNKPEYSTNSITNKGGASDMESTEGSSRVSSPTPSISSINSGFSLSDAAKQLSNTKRGSKILPVASEDGQTRYLCPVCSLELSNDHELTVHIRSHNSSGQQAMPNTCTICGKTLSSQSSLDRHMLVHSGERPFKCKICDMSFTTNGNMHRHSRIHEKNGITTPKPAGRKQGTESKASSKRSYPYHEDKLMSGSPAGLGQGAIPSLASDYANDKMGLFNQQHEQNAFFQQYCRLIFPFNSPHHPAFPYPHLLHDPARMTLPYLQQAMMGPMSGMSPAKRARFAHPFIPPAREPSPDLRAQQKFNCSECSAVFTNQFSLESHLETHVIVDEKLEAESGTACKECKKVAKSEESLLLHALIHHKVEEDLAEPDSKVVQKSPTSSPSPLTLSGSISSTASTNNSASNGNGGVGFQGLGFASFTTKKFPLIAKAYCESSPTTKGFRFPVFKCQECDQEFPVEGAKNLHEASHVPEEYTVCPKCNCHFSESSRLQEHMQRHVADKKFEDSEGQTCLEVAESMTQNYFLAQFGLVAKEDSGQEHLSNCDDMDVSVKEEPEVSDDEISKMANSDIDDDNRSESSKLSQTSKEKLESSRTSLRPSIFLHPNVSSSLSGNGNLSSLPSGKAAQAQSQVNPNLLPNILNSHSPTPSGDSDEDPGSRGSPFEVLDRSMPPMFPCKYCDMVLSTPQALKHHQRTHKNTPQFLCKVCSYSSTDKSTLMRHMRTHSGERPYACCICDYSFTTKANCERHLKQKHGVSKDQLSDKLTCNRYIIANRKISPPSLDERSSGSQPQNTVCKSCGVDFFSGRSLQQHLYVSPDCRTGFMCKRCKTSFSSRYSVLQHMSQHHSDIPSHHWENFIVNVETTSPSLNDKKTIFSTPPPAHSKKTVSPATKISSSFEHVVVKKEPKFSNYSDPADNAEMLAKMNAVIKQRSEGKIESNVDKPLDFSKQSKAEASLLYQQQQHSLNMSRSSSVSLSEDDQSLDDVPVDLTVSRPSHSSPWTKGQGQGSSSQSLYGFSRQVKEEPKTPTNIKFGSSKNINIPYFLENPGQPPRRSDGNNNQLSPLFTLTASASAGNSIPQQLSPFRPTSGGSAGSKSDMAGPSLSPHTPKHPAFPPFLPMIPSYPSVLSPAAAQNLALQGHPALPATVPKLAFMPNRRPSLLGSAASPAGGAGGPSSVGSGGSAKSGTDGKSGTSDSLRSARGLGIPKDIKEAPINKQSKSEKVTGLEDLEKDAEENSAKETSCESDSSCELASVNKILDATDAQNFQDYLVIPETEDEQDNKSESVDSGEDSNQSLENMYSRSQSLSSGALMGSRPRPDESTTEEGKAGGHGGLSLTVNMALIEDRIPSALREKVLKEETSFTDPSNMSEQAIAALIEKVSQENVSSPAKKKRNSYADSPHKFSCPYCPRCFPWLSSLNRHLLTHTGQKPFKCPRCPVTFSTKSNRERHLIRKHNVNMLDPASRSTMDRPYKCHLCVFSSFSTQSNLIKHYKDRHNNVSPPPHILEAGDKAMSDGEGEDGLLNGGGASYEDEEEFNTLAEMRGGLSDKDIMLQNYVQDSDSNHSGKALSPFRDPHKKRNTIFSLNGENEPVNNGTNNSKVNGSGTNVNSSNCNGSKNSIMSLPVKSSSHMMSRPGIDDTVLSDTMKSFLDKSVRQALEDSHRRALEEGSKFVITPAIERHLRRLPNNSEQEVDLCVNQHLQCSKCNIEFPSQKLLIKHIKEHSGSDPPFKCYLCEMSFARRVECLQHQELVHQADWAILKEKNEIGNVQVFATRLDKMIDKLCKKGREILEKQDKEGPNGETQGTKEEETDSLKLSDKSEKTADNKETVPEEEMEEKPESMASLKEEKDGITGRDNDEILEPGVLQDVVTTDYLLRKVHCSLCPKRFWSLQDLRRHMRSHTGEQPYRCDICFQKFTLKHSMNRHKAKYHAGAQEGGQGIDILSDDDGSSSDASGKPKTRSSHAKGISPLISKLKGNLVPAMVSSSDSNTCTSSDKNNNDNNGHDSSGSASGNDEDMLHNLLGVESSTIDQIFESKDSAASLLGV